MNFLRSTPTLMINKMIQHVWEKFLLIVLVCLGISVLVTIVQPFEYKSTVKMLIIDQNPRTSDFYAASRGLEKVADTLGRIVQTDSFFQKVVNTQGAQVSAEMFGRTEKKRRKKWDKAVDVSGEAGTSIMYVDTYSKSAEQSKDIAQAISIVLVNEGREYLGHASTLQVKEIDSVLTSSFPVRPNIIKNIVFGLIAGIGLGFLWAYIKLERDVFQTERLRESDEDRIDGNKFNHIQA